jgi:hypothetical protein
MDTPNLLVPAIVAIALVIMPRLILQSVGRASEGIAQLFVPPDRALGWPRGVQESDEPWAWRVPATADRVGGRGPAPDVGPPVLVELADVPFELIDLPSKGAAIHDALIVSVHPVQPRHRA